MNRTKSNEFKFVIERSMYRISQELDACIRQFYEPFGLTAPQAMILLYIHRNHQGKVTEVARELHMTNSNLSTICRRLERDGFIQRTRDLEDQRIVWLTLTENCKQRLIEMEARIDSQYLNELGDLSPEDKEDILKGLTKLEAILSKRSL